MRSLHAAGWLLVLGVAAAGCRAEVGEPSDAPPDDGSGDPFDDPSDDPPGGGGQGARDAAPRPSADGASQGSDAAGVRDDVIGTTCTGSMTGLRIALGDDLQAGGGCYPVEGDITIVLLPSTATVAPGQSVLLSDAADGNFAYRCPAEIDAQCQRVTAGEVRFDAFELGVAAAGAVALADGFKAGFEAAWCTPTTTCP